jgi:hypothetical protein
MNSVRWLEYSVTSSVMIVLINILFGVRDLQVLVLVFVSNAAVMLLGCLVEWLYIEKTIDENASEEYRGKMESYQKYVFAVASLVGLQCWFPLFIQIHINWGKYPSFVIWIFVTYFVFYNSFAFV